MMQLASLTSSTVDINCVKFSTKDVGVDCGVGKVLTALK
jgi:hypothetical protein